MVFCKKSKKKDKQKLAAQSMPTIYEQPGSGLPFPTAYTIFSTNDPEKRYVRLQLSDIIDHGVFPGVNHQGDKRAPFPMICARMSSFTPLFFSFPSDKMTGWPLQKTQNFRQIEVSVTAFLETINQQKSMYKVKLPHFVIHDFDDEEESKIIRMILTLADVPYECKVVQRDDYLLEDYPFYVLPALEIDGKKIGSVPSICRQLGWRYELSGQTARDDTVVDMIAEKIYETRMQVKNWLDHIEHREEHECDDTCSTSCAIVFIDGLCRQLEAILKNNNSSWYVGHKMTWTDLLSTCLLNPIAYHMPSVLEPFPNLYLHTKRISELDRFSGFLYHLKGINM